MLKSDGILKCKLNIEAKEHGFTLLELVLATFISSLVIGILAVALSFSLRLWERQQNIRESDAPRVIELLRWQVANFNPVPFKVEDSEQIMFNGSGISLTLATNFSVRAISGGVPVVARYIFDERNKVLYYAEIPLNPYNSDAIDAFLRMAPGDTDRPWPVFYATEVDHFSLQYLAESDETPTDAWDDPEVPPMAMYVNWKPIEGSTAVTTAMFPSAFFPEILPFENESALPGLDED